MARSRLIVVGIDHVFASGAVVGRATTHEWGQQRNPKTQRTNQQNQKDIKGKKEVENNRLNKIIQERDEEIQTLKQNLADKEKELTETKEKLLQILLKKGKTETQKQKM